MKKGTASFSALLEAYFTQRLMQQKQASPHTVGSYRDTFRLLLKFAERRLGKQPSRLDFKEIDAPLIADFLKEIEDTRGASPRTRNLRLTAIRSFFRYAAFETPEHALQIQRVLAIPGKRFSRSVVNYLTKPEVEALLGAPNQSTWSGRRDYALLLVAVHTGLRLSELTSLKQEDVTLSTGSHVRVIGKGRKERCIPLTKNTANILKAWIEEPTIAEGQPLFPNARGQRLSADGVQYILRKHLVIACQSCSLLQGKHVTPHTLRHTMAMELLQAGVEQAMIALWLGHESIETTQIYLHANMAMKEEILSRTSLPAGKSARYSPDDQLLQFLKTL